MSSIDPVTGKPKEVPVIPLDKQGFNALDTEAFMKLLITQLQNQDPSNPMSNEELLSQISQMRNLTSDIELTDALEGLTLSQQLNSSTAFLGKEIKGTTANGTEVSGVVDRVYVKDKASFLVVGDKEVPLTNVTDVTNES
ncbi:flagellar hook assembly protein FlgD [Planctopirus hydrillae]|uniref:Basal-body rod modification protein FlgD n=1 Tax=Planctopirus hydrillae TaxID=1841610 RepID=A0A1C3ECV7_9PLAN|nr:flagellar hook capping FlgD N-terminal domain-containing protein [Planctopirus hydrillae]ODA31082.1 flagellar hook capping protein [Planctopirus hydrillae]